MDSRSLAFADEIMRITGGQGVHIVLNSVAGHGRRKSLAVLSPFGRFLEIGKRDFLDNSQLGLRPFEKCLSLHAIDIDQLMRQEGTLVGSLLQEIMASVRDGTYQPLSYRAFPVWRAVEAFRYMQQARHIGKVVVTMREQDAPVAPATCQAPMTLAPDGTYLISGGLGGFGLATARWMVERGARHLVLAGRSGAASPQAQRAVGELREAGAEVLVAQVDVTQDEQVRELVGVIRASLPPLRGIVHAAMVLDDCFVLHLDSETFTRALAPKALGAWNLHEQTLREPLDFFVLFSSMTSVVGTIGQANYVAANAFLDSFVAFRSAHGLPAMAINWGAIADVGYVAEKAERGERLLHRGGRAIPAYLALKALERLLLRGRLRATVSDFDWQQAEAVWLVRSPRWADLLLADGQAVPSGEHPEAFRQRLLSLPDDERTALLTARLSDYLARVLGTSSTAIDPERPMTDAGMDSLTAMEVRTRIQHDLDVRVSEMHLTTGQSVVDLAKQLLEQLSGNQPALRTRENTQV